MKKELENIVIVQDTELLAVLDEVNAMLAKGWVLAGPIQMAGYGGIVYMATVVRKTHGVGD